MNALTPPHERNLEIGALLRARRFDEARALLARVGLDLDRDPRAPKVRRARHRFERPVFVCGLHRSGTTLVHDMLAAHYDLAFIDKGRVPEKEGQFLQNVYPLERPFGGPGAFAFYPQMRFAPVTDRKAAKEMSAKLLRQWAARASDTSRHVLLEKSPPNLIRIPFLRSLFPEARFVVWTRDPRAVTLATQKWHPIPVNTLMHHWNAAFMTVLQDLGEDCLVMRYEDFCAAPETELSRIATFAGLEKRAEPLELNHRFREIRNTNAKYIEAFQSGLRFRAQVRAWEIFGYDLSA